MNNALLNSEEWQSSCPNNHITKYVNDVTVSSTDCTFVRQLVITYLFRNKYMGTNQYIIVKNSSAAT